MNPLDCFDSTATLSARERDYAARLRYLNHNTKLRLGAFLFVATFTTLLQAFRPEGWGLPTYAIGNGIILVLCLIWYLYQRWALKRHWFGDKP